MSIKRITKKLQLDNTLLPTYSQVIFFLVPSKTNLWDKQYLEKNEEFGGYFGAVEEVSKKRKKFCEN